jgi:hypothetical protein
VEIAQLDTVVISGGGKGDQPIGSPDVKVSGRRRATRQVVAQANGQPRNWQHWKCRTPSTRAKASVVGEGTGRRQSTSFPGSLKATCREGTTLRKRGTARGSPRRSRTAKVSRISRIGEVAMCPRVGRMGPISVDGPGQHNPVWSEGPWGHGSEVAVTDEATGPTLIGRSATAESVTKGGSQPPIRPRMLGASLSGVSSGKAPSDKPAPQPYWGKPAVRNVRGGRGNVGIIRSPVRASSLPDNLLVRIWGGPGLGNRPRLLDNSCQ